MTVQRLRDAAKVLRKAASEAVAGPWVAEVVESDDDPGCYDEVQVNAGSAATQWEDRVAPSGTPFRIGTKPSSWFSTDRIVARDTFSDEEDECSTHAANAEYIATVDPLVGLALADWLEATARDMDWWEDLNKRHGVMCSGCDNCDRCAEMSLAAPDGDAPALHAHRIADLILGGAA